MVRRGVQWVAWAALAAWGASYSRTGWVAAPGGYGVLLDDGSVYLGKGARVYSSLGASQAVTVRPAFGTPPTYIKTGFVLPLWLTFVLAAVALWPVWRFGFERRQRALAGCCPACRYDLAGIDGVCPECGNRRPVA